MNLQVTHPSNGGSSVAHCLGTGLGGSQPDGGVESLMQNWKNSDERPDNHEDPSDPDEAPTTPTDEPQPVPVQDPPAEPDQAPYVVAGDQTGR
jgi:hypothetical protein